MILIAGLGNPTGKYAGTKHNVGFCVIDRLAEDYHINVTAKKYQALCGQGYIGGQKVLLLKPQTYMNLSGLSVRAAADFYKIAPEDILVIFDDVSLDVGQLRIRKKGSAGGHNGIKSIIAQLGSQDFPRIKVGVGQKPADWDLADYVLSRFSDGDRAQIEEAFKSAAEAVAVILTDGIDAAMNRFNAKKTKAPADGAQAKKETKAPADGAQAKKETKAPADAKDRAQKEAPAADESNREGNF